MPCSSFMLGRDCRRSIGGDESKVLSDFCSFRRRRDILNSEKDLKNGAIVRWGETVKVNQTLVRHSQDTCALEDGRRRKGAVTERGLLTAINVKQSAIAPESRLGETLRHGKHLRSCGNIICMRRTTTTRLVLYWVYAHCTRSHWKIGLDAYIQ